MEETINPDDIQLTTSLRKLKEMRKKLKKARNQPFTRRLIEQRIQQIQQSQLADITFESNNRLLNFLKRIIPK